MANEWKETNYKCACTNNNNENNENRKMQSQSYRNDHEMNGEARKRTNHKCHAKHTAKLCVWLLWNDVIMANVK